MTTAHEVSQSQDFERSWYHRIVANGGTNPMPNQARIVNGRWARVWRFPDGSGIAVFGRAKANPGELGALDYTLLDAPI